MCKRMLIVALTVLATTAAPACADDRYYMIVLASQGEPNLPKLAHTFAVFVKVSGEGMDPKKFKVETKTISWLPKSLDIEPLRLRPEPGRNLSLQESLKFAESTKSRVAMWGPFLVKKKVHDLALKRIEVLEGGKVEYVVLDRRFRSETATNCIHAVSDLDLEQPLLATGTAHGEEASRLVLQHLERWIVPSTEDHHWLADRLDLKKETIRVIPIEKTGNP